MRLFCTKHWGWITYVLTTCINLLNFHLLPKRILGLLSQSTPWVPHILLPWLCGSSDSLSLETVSKQDGAGWRFPAVQSSYGSLCTLRACRPIRWPGALCKPVLACCRNCCPLSWSAYPTVIKHPGFTSHSSEGFLEVQDEGPIEGPLAGYPPHGFSLALLQMKVQISVSCSFYKTMNPNMEALPSSPYLNLKASPRPHLQTPSYWGPELQQSMENECYSPRFKLHLFIWGEGCTTQCMCGGPRTTCRSLFSSYTMWVPGIDLRCQASWRVPLPMEPSHQPKSPHFIYKK